MRSHLDFERKEGGISPLLSRPVNIGNGRRRRGEGERGSGKLDFRRKRLRGDSAEGGCRVERGEGGDR